MPSLGSGAAPAGVKVWIKVSGTWKLATPYTRVGGIWKITTPYIKIAGVWKGSSFDADALTYINAVETADGAALEEGVKVAINNFVVGCKSDGIWNSIKACCILAGARTLNGALVPLVGTAPTNNNFVNADYNRKIGPIGDGTTKFISTNRNNNADPQNNQHLAVWVTAVDSQTSTVGLIGVGGSLAGTSQISNLGDGRYFIRSQSTTSVIGTTFTKLTGFHGISRNSSSNVNAIISGIPVTNTLTSETPLSETINVFGRGVSPYYNGRISFYSIGENLNLTSLSNRINILINAYATAIP